MGSAICYAGMDYHTQESIVGIKKRGGYVIQGKRVRQILSELFGGLFG